MGSELDLTVCRKMFRKTPNMHGTRNYAWKILSSFMLEYLFAYLSSYTMQQIFHLSIQQILVDDVN